MTIQDATGRIGPPGRRPRNILIAVDFTEMCAPAIDRAFALVRDDPDAELAAVTVAMPDGPHLAVDLGDVVKRLSESEALRFTDGWVKERLDALGVMESRGPRGLAVYVAAGDPVAEIVRVATDIHADLVVMGTHGRRGIRRLVLGSVAEGVVRRAQCDVLVVRQPETPIPGEDVPTLEGTLDEDLRDRRPGVGPALRLRTYRQFNR
jgi:nucleotide-binding universal stress UspA family protein